MQLPDEILAAAHERAHTYNLIYSGALTPQEAWRIWHGDLRMPHAFLVDVRTQAELDFVGRIPGAIEIEWIGYPERKINPRFIQQLEQETEPDATLLFICRSGGRSHEAATLATQLGFNACYNVLEGFEGDRDKHGQRGRINGWRFAGLPWVQS